MANFSGVLTKAAIKRPSQTSAYGDAAGSMTNLLPLISESMTNAVTFDEDDTLVGAAGRAESSIVSEHPSGTITTELWYEGLEYLLFAAFGFECPTLRTTAYGTDGTTNNGSPAPDHITELRAWHRLFELDDTLHRVPWGASERKASSGTTGDAVNWTAAHQKVRCFDLLIDKGEPSGYVWRYLNCMVNSMTIRAGLDGVSAEWGLSAYKQDLLATGSAGTWTTGTNAYSKERAVFPHLSVGLAAVGASAPAAIAVKEITLTLSNPLADDWASGSKYKIEPIRTGPRKVSGTIKLARYADNTFPTALTSETDFMLDLKFASPNIIKTGANASSQSWVNTLEFICPLVRFTKANFPVAGPGVIEGDIEFEAFVPTSYPAWIAGAGGPARYIDLKKSQEMMFVGRNSRPFCFSRDNVTGALVTTALP